MNRITRRIIKGFVWGAFLGGFFVVLAVSLVLAGEIYDFKDTFDGTHLLKVDAVVCLAGGRGRIAATGDLWLRYFTEFQERQNQALKKKDFPNENLGLPMLYISGMGAHSNFQSFTKQIRRPVLEVLKPDHVYLEIESTNTLENIQILVEQIKERDWKAVLLVTSAYHMKRANRILERLLKEQGLIVKIETHSIYNEPFEPQEWRTSTHGIRVTVEEYIKWLYIKYFWSRWPSSNLGLNYQKPPRMEFFK